LVFLRDQGIFSRPITALPGDGIGSEVVFCNACGDNRRGRTGAAGTAS
jgi:hypothetical protein